MIQIVDRLIVRIKERHPGFEIRFKDQPLPFWLRPVFRLQGLISTGFWDQSITRVGDHVYFPSRTMFEHDQVQAFAALAYEFVRMHDSAMQSRILFSARYLFPQVTIGLFSLLGMFGIFHASFYAFFVLLLALAPWPAPWRLKIEQRGHQMSILSLTMMGEPINRAHIIDRFMTHYWMTCDKETIIGWLDDEVVSAQANLSNINTFDRPYRDVVDVYRTNMGIRWKPSIGR